MLKMQREKTLCGRNKGKGEKHNKRSKKYYREKIYSKEKESVMKEKKELEVGYRKGQWKSN